MNYRFSSAISSFCGKTDLFKAMSLVKEAGYDGLDFPFSVYSVGYQPPLLQDNWKSWVKSVQKHAENLGLFIFQGHAAWLQDIPADFSYVKPEELYFRTLEAASILGCKHVIFHPVRLRERVENLSVRQRIHDWNVRWFHELIPAAEKFDVYINLENTFDSHNLQKPGDPLHAYTTGEDMLNLLQDLSSDRIRLCLDTGHANNAGQDIPAMIRLFRSDLATIHLNDNFGFRGEGFSDLHLFPGEGNICWPEVLKALEDIRFRGVMNIEPIADLPGISDLQRRERLAVGLGNLCSMLSV